MTTKGPSSPPQVALGEVQVEKACPESWDGMAGDQRSRFCGICQKHVHNVEAYSAKEFSALVAASPSLPCVRVPVRSERLSLRPNQRKLRVVQTAAVAMFSATLACNEIQSIGENALNAATGKGATSRGGDHKMGEMMVVPPRPPPPVLTATDAGIVNADAGLPRDAGADAKPVTKAPPPPAPTPAPPRPHKVGIMVAPHDPTRT